MTRPSYVYACPCGYETTKGSNARRHAKTCVHDTMTKTRATTGATTTGATTNDPTADDVLWTHRLYALGLGFGGQTDPVPPMPPGYGVRV